MSKAVRFQMDDEAGARQAIGTPANLVAIVNELEEDIVFGRLHPCQRLIEDDLITRFAVKRHVVRQALVDLERTGLIERIPNRGALVRAYNPDEVKQLYVVRDLLETQAARLIPLPLPDADLGDIRAAQAYHDAAVAAGDLRGVFRTNITFHRTLFGKCGNVYLAEIINDFAQRTHGIRFYSLADPDNAERARQEHWGIISALESGDRQALVDLCSRHLIASKEAYLRAYRIYGT